MSSVNFIGGGLDVLGIVENLLFVEREPIRRLEKRSQSFQDRISAFQNFNTKLLAFKTSVEKLLYNGSSVPLSMPSDFATRLKNSVFSARVAASSDDSIVTATAKNGITAGSFSVTVENLARTNSHASNNFDSITATATKTGTLTIQKGTGSPVDIVIDSTNNTLAGIRDAINDAKAGFTASIINDGSANPFRLVVTSDESGTANALNITNNLNQGGGQDVLFAETVAAEDAELTVNGIAITRSSNTVIDAIEGVTLNLKAETAAEVQISVNRDLDAIVEAVKEFAAKYSDVTGFISSQFKYDAGKKTAGVLSGDPTLRNAQSMLHSTISNSIDSNNATLKVLSQIGIELSNDGSMKVNETKLRESLAGNFEETAHVLLADATNGSGNIISIAPQLLSHLKGLTDPFGGSVFQAKDAVQQNINRIQKQIRDMESRLESRREILIAQFTRADVALKQLTALQSSLSSQIGSLRSFSK